MHPEYDVLLVCDVYGSDGRASLEKSIRLPFAPFAGLDLWHADPAIDQGDRVLNVAWLCGPSRFVCQMQGDRDGGLTLGELIPLQLAYGYAVVSRVGVTSPASPRPA